MRKGLTSVLMIPLLLLAGCGEREARMEHSFTAFRDALIDTAGVTAHASLTADTGGAVADYELEIAYDGQETAVTVTEPALIAGVTAKAKWGESTIAYDGVMLGAGALDENGLTPVSAVPAMLEAMAGGYKELLWWDGELVAARLYVSETSRCTVWLDPDTSVPQYAEISSDGKRVISCTFTDWELSITPGGE